MTLSDGVLGGTAASTCAFFLPYVTYAVGKSLPLGGKVSTNGRRMRGQRFLLMSVSVGLCVYRELWKSLTLFVKMIFRISKPLIRLGIRRATFPPRGRLISSKTRSVSLNYSFFNLQFSVFIHLHVPVEKSLLIQQYTSVTQIKGTRAPPEKTVTYRH